MFFFRFTQTNGTDARQFYDSMITKYRKSETRTTWKEVTKFFTNRYEAVAKHAEISNRLNSIKINGVIKDDQDKYVELDKLTKIINELEPMACVKERDNEAMVKFLRQERSGACTPNKEFQQSQNYNS